ncbi:hypothetical protein MCOR27_009989 [Pyricularia oryzae]|uniref:Uncharacterized protein n=6 Tax=Pyricularia TaxID=48558 RepID=G5EHC8_PYRO7|nr:uncharacterized protein MGG_02805 [Pyricularia oryzae 70-15]XP_030979554.1 hypothetical protein PgNI_10573 [Pyricularia grisea]ELQ41113.1 hypothetical protein OOU_Y34scaffold00301g33 [Pyricularia oryzae Y34]KAH8838345.1 hypothetical protein MCOR01_009785 [Pyricularia oryzae]EAQ71151.1 hypothetical protein MGCH7_ch7g558 [Pyricularia oryzae 70-15]EHA46193.1 hypothetical protein MGG_02805 [Pyricularia oryzae 70-15]KAH9436918.1 hypothetical protein MCOR02_000582 [Pyricularia oryzae]
MGAVMSSIGNCLRGIVNAIGSMIQAIISGIVSIFNVLINCITCGYARRSGGGRRRTRTHRTTRV